MKIQISAIVCILLITLGCSKENSAPTINSNISYLNAKLGGCNNKSTENIIQDVDKNDTVIISLSNDTLHILAGLNYVCCAPFITDCEIQQDSIFINIIDTCSNPYSSCYCRCSCFYTFDFMYSGISKKKYFWQIVLSDPREENDRVFKEGYIDVEAML